MTLHAVRLPGAKRDVYVAPGTVFVPVAPELIEELSGDWSETVQFRFGEAEDGAVELWLRSVDHGYPEDDGPFFGAETRFSRPAEREDTDPEEEPIPWRPAIAVGYYRQGVLLEYNGPTDAIMYAREFSDTPKPEMPGMIEVRYYCPAPATELQVGVDRGRKLWRHEPKEAA